MTTAKASNFQDLGVNAETAGKMIEIAWKAGETPFVYGKAGVGKTAIAIQKALAHGMRVLIIRAAEIRPEDATGAPIPHLDQMPAGLRNIMTAAPVGFSMMHPPRELMECTKEWHDQQRQKHDYHVERGAVLRGAIESAISGLTAAIQGNDDPGVKRHFALLNAAVTAAGKLFEGYAEPGLLARLATIEDDAKIGMGLEAVNAFKAASDAVVLPTGAYPKPQPVCIIFDELPNAPIETQATLHSLINDREFGLGGYKLLDEVRMIATGNRGQDGAYVQEMSAPLRSRFSPHILMEENASVWIKWARENGVHPSVIASVSQHEGLMHTYDAKSQDVTFSCPRTLVKASEYVKLSSDDPDLLLHLLQKTVGQAAASVIYTTVTVGMRAPRLEDICRNPDETPAEWTEPDIPHVVRENILQALRNDPTWMREVFSGAKSEGDAYKQMVDAFIRWGRRMNSQNRKLLFGGILNVDGRMPRKVIDAALTSQYRHDLQKECVEYNVLLGDGDNAFQRTNKKKA